MGQKITHTCLLNRQWVSLAVTDTLDMWLSSLLVLGVQGGERSVLDLRSKFIKG